MSYIIMFLFYILYDIVHAIVHNIVLLLSKYTIIVKFDIVYYSNLGKIKMEEP